MNYERIFNGENVFIIIIITIIMIGKYFPISYIGKITIFKMDI